MSSFGISGTNAHLILEEAPTGPARDTPTSHADQRPAVPCLVSATTREGVREQAARLRSHLEARPDLDVADTAFSLATTRAALKHRSVVVADDRAALVRGLEALAEDEETPGVLHGQNRGQHVLAMLFPGQGAQRPGMGRGLYSAFPEYARALDEVCAYLDPHLDRPLRDVMFAEEGSIAAGMLDQTGFTQPALFATGVALFRLLESWEVCPDLLAGHSIGELAAAHVAGVLSLPDACALVAARGRLMQQLPTTGAMLAVRTPETDVLPLLDGRADSLGIAAVNGPRSTVVSGDADAVAEVEEHLTTRGAKTRRLRVSHAFHSPHMDGVLPEFRAVAESVTYHQPRVPIVSNLTGEPVTAEVCSADYWTRHVRETVRFHDGIRELDRQGATTLLELGPDASVSAMARECLPEEASTDVVPTLRTGQDEGTALVTALGGLHAEGVTVDWRAFFADWGVTRVPLPTYAFQRRRYWLNSGTPTSAAAPAGVETTDHPLLDTATELADGSGLLCTGRLSLRAQPWLADHTVGGAVLLPATAFVELALRAGARAGCDTLEELLLEDPLVLPEHGSLAVQVVVGAPEESGRRSFTVHARAQDDDTETWRRHASGALQSGARPATGGTGPWPPATTPVNLDGGYQLLEERGYGYGPAFRGLRALWRDGDDTFAEVTLPEDVGDSASSFGLHPALLDAVLHAFLLGTDDDGLRLPFSISGLTLHATGASRLRARIAPAGGDAVSLVLTDPAGAPVATVDRLVTQPVSGSALADARTRSRDSLFSLDWVPATEPPADRAARVAVVGSGASGLVTDDASHAPDLPSLLAAIDGGRAVPDVVFAECPTGQEAGLASATGEVTRHVLELLQAWLADGRLAESRLVVVTRGAVATTPGEDVARLSQAPVWGLVRSARSEHPDRFALLDLGGDGEAPVPALPALAAATAREPQLAYREGAGLVPRLARLRESALSGAPELDPRGTVLVTGGTGKLGGLVARRLVAEHGARRLVLLSRSGAQATGADALSAELTAMGAHVTIERCDASDREALAAVLATIPTEHPLTMVVHAAGVLDDATVHTLTAEQLDRVLAAKVAGAVNLHELTAEHPLAAFVMFSSIMGLVGGPGQGNYAAANAFLDALSQHRRALGAPGLSLAWGLWEGDGGVTGDLGDADRRRMARDGLVPISPEAGQELFGAVLGAPSGVAVPARLNLAALRARAEPDEVPAVLRHLVGDLRHLVGETAPGPAADTDPAPTTGEGLADRIASRPEAERHTVVLELVRSVIATVLGESGPESIAPDRAFQDLGFDSLTAVELRNRLGKATGLRLPATLVFDYPTPDALAHYVLEQLAPGGGATSLEEIDRLERTLLSLEPDGETSAQVTTRLQALLAKWQANVGDEAEDADDHDLDAASDDELFDLLDKELGEA
ncbi:SDR family NAD(P)-dependent oxidoreductase [Halostreptopolyspora alba]|uniref:SDR family NAD(P)-dependent oxidoreductase n=1 Tax=Halostreptopolyspora alba TaxID=2487137 RepID=A0A3N0DQV5_9ACTN|nr:SDR family NAD(P)-dependent oxidoreductase [Nocardiopsaceae bacterium YIM 96095]